MRKNILKKILPQGGLNSMSSIKKIDPETLMDLKHKFYSIMNTTYGYNSNYP